MQATTVSKTGENRVGCSSWSTNFGAASPRSASGRTAYVRFHCTGGKYWGPYSDDALLSWKDWCLEQSRFSRGVWCYFNNDIHGHAIEDARTLESMIDQSPARERPFV